MVRRQARAARAAAWAATVLAAVVELAGVGSAARAGVVELDGRRFTLPDGFTIERVAGPPRVDRPIVADFDELGRLYVADSSGSSEPVQKQLRDKPHRIVRLEDGDGDGRFDRQTAFADRMMFPEGAMWHAGSLYVAAPPSIWKLTDTDGDGVADRREEWFAGKTLTGCANDLHGPYLGLDGWIYWCKGAFAEQRYPRPGGRPDLVTRAAHIFRARPDGSGVEPVMTGGMDNPVEVAFTAAGERIFTTTFFQHPAGGQRDGLVHAIYGGVYGKPHDVVEGHPRTSPELMPVLTHLGPAAPSGLTRYESDAFGKEYEGNLFAALFNLRKVTRHELVPAGATFTTRDHDFVVCDDLDFHPTDVLEDADGSLLILDTGGWYKLCCPTSQLVKPDLLGAIYRVRRTGAPKVEDPRGLKLAWEALDAAGLARLLEDRRPAVRRRAGLTLPSRPGAVAALREALASKGSSSRARLGAVWALTRVEGAEARAAARGALNDSDATVRQAAAHSAGVRRDAGTVEALVERVGSDAPPVRRAAAEALGRIGDGRAVPALLAALAEGPAADRALEHSLTYALIEIADAKSTAGGLASRDLRVRRCAMMALDQMPGGSLDAKVVIDAMNSADAALRDSAAWVATRHAEWGEALAGLLRERLRRADLPEAERGRLRGQLALLARSPAVQGLLASELTSADAPRTSRLVALAAIREAGVRNVPKPWIEALAATIASEDAALVGPAIAAARALPLNKGNRAPIDVALVRAADRGSLPPAARIDALAALPPRFAAVSQETLAFLKEQLGSPQLALRQAAAEAVGRSKLTSGQLIAVAGWLGAVGPAEADRLLGAFEQSDDEAVGTALVAALDGAKSVASLPPDSVRRRLERFPPAVRERGEAILAKANPGSAAQRERLDKLLATLPGGDVRRGQLVFNSERAACVTCHAIGYVGGDLGPDLTRVGAVRQPRDLLESILYPSASFVQSYEPLLVVTKDNDRHAGVVKKDDAEEVVLATGPGQLARIPRGRVKSVRRSPLSVMPEGLDELLSEQELADLLAFLRACK